MHNVDQGTAFGTWGDPTSRFMYETSLKPILALAKLEGHVGDFGGANGLLKHHVPQLRVTTIDNDPLKQPDVEADILTHDAPYDVAWCRYVMHYLNDQQVMEFVRNVNAPRLIIVQFTNEDLRAKYANSINEYKYFRTASQMRALLPANTVELCSYSYEVGPDFYLNRLGLATGVRHPETLKVYEVVRGSL